MFNLMVAASTVCSDTVRVERKRSFIIYLCSLALQGNGVVKTHLGVYNSGHGSLIFIVG